MYNRYLEIKYHQGSAAARAQIARDTDEATAATNPVALAGLLHEMMTFFAADDASFDHKSVAKIPELMIVLDQITWWVARKNVAPGAAWAWLSNHEQQAG
jgi:hypothetical protein